MAQFSLATALIACAAGHPSVVGHHDAAVTSGAAADANSTHAPPRQSDAAALEAASEDAGADPTSIVALPTVIHVINGSDTVRSRFEPCWGHYTIRVVLRGEVPASTTTCFPVACESLGSSDVVAPSTECSAPSCADGIVDIAPGESDRDYTWDGVYRHPTERNCWQLVSLRRDTPVVALVCYGTSDAQGALPSVGCEQHEFEYGAEETTATLR